MSVELFIDTNIFIYQLDTTDPRKQQIAERIVRDGIAHRNTCISYQVIQEFLNAAIRKAEVPLDDIAIRTFLVTILEPLYSVPASIALFQRALSIWQKIHFSFYDSLIVAAALEAGSSRLISEVMQHGQQIESLRIENPFRL